jgi:hypothetical protein
MHAGSAVAATHLRDFSLSRHAVHLGEAGAGRAAKLFSYAKLTTSEEPGFRQRPPAEAFADCRIWS